MLCLFAEGPNFVAVHQGPVKGMARMREKLLEYAHAGDAWADWPLTANILDPIRTTIVCNGPSQILQAGPYPRFTQLLSLLSLTSLHIPVDGFFLSPRCMMVTVAMVCFVAKSVMLVLPCAA
jgi:hypothetical protein